jgi:hypothetical protein
MWTHPIKLVLPIAALVLAACDSPSGPRVAASVEMTDGDGQTATVGTALPGPLVVRVTDAGGRPVAGHVVNFVVTSGEGSLFAGTTQTGTDGIAQDRWTLGTSASEPHRVEVRSVVGGSGEPRVFGTFTATAAPGPPAVVSAVANDLAGVPGQPVEDSLAAMVVDAYGNGVPNALVTWSVTSGGGNFARDTSRTDAHGIARAQWTLGMDSAPTQTAQASSAGAGNVSFHAQVVTAMAGVSVPSGLGTAGQDVGKVSVRVSGEGYGISNVPVRWTVGGGGTAPATSRTNTDGVAEVTWTLGPTHGAQTLTASVANLQVTFQAVAVGTGRRTQVAEIPGRVLDYDGRRVLWLDSAGGRRAIKLRDGVTDATVAADSGFTGALFSGGALASRGDGLGGSLIVEYRNGALTTLGPGQSLSVEGAWAAWAVESRGPVLRRDLAAGTTASISVPSTSTLRTTISVDVGPGGEVAYEYFVYDHGNMGRQLLRLYRNGTTTEIPIDNYGWSAGGPTTDGVNVLYHTASILDGLYRLWVYGFGGDPLLGTGVSGTQAGGWVAYNHFSGFSGRWIVKLRLRSPTGAEEEASPPLTSGAPLALAPDGTLVFYAGTRIYLKPLGSDPVDVGATFPWNGKVVWRGGTFYLLTGGTVYELSR